MADEVYKKPEYQRLISDDENPCVGCFDCDKEMCECKHDENDFPRYEGDRTDGGKVKKNFNYEGGPS